MYSYGCVFPGSGVTVPTGGIKCKQYSLGDVGYRALRGSLRFNPSDRLDMLLSADYARNSAAPGLARCPRTPATRRSRACVNPEVVAGTNGPCSSDPAVIKLLSSTPLGFIKEQLHAGVQYQFGLSSGSTLTPRLDAAYQGPQPGSNLAPAPGSPSARYGQVSGFTVANARVTWRNAKKDLESTLEVTNMFNKDYFYSKFDLTGAGSGTITGSPAPPLAWAVTVKKSF